MAGVYISYWTTISFILALLAVAMSFKPSRRSYWVAAISYSLIVVGSAFLSLSGIIFSISMASAFSTHSVPPTAFIFPIVMFAVFAIPVLTLFPIFTLQKAKKMGHIFFASVFALILLWAFWTFLRSPMQFNGLGMNGFLLIALYLLWIRIIELRKNAVEQGAAANP